MTTLFLILIGIVILLCIALNNVSSRIGIPTLLAFIVLGMVFVTKAFDDSKTYLVEKTVKKGGKRAGRTIRETSGSGLVLLVRRGGEEIIPSGDTLLLEGDRLVILRGF